jgi:hypothetical protein
MSILFRSSHVSYNVSLKHVQLFKKIRQGIQEDTSAADEVRPKPHVMLAKRLRPQPQTPLPIGGGEVRQRGTSATLGKNPNCIK